MAASAAPADKLLPLFRERNFWAQLQPGLTISSTFAPEALAPWPPPSPDPAAFRAELDREGYVHLPQILEPELTAKLAATVTRLASLGIPPVFALVFDQFWVPVFRLRKILATALGADCAVLPAFWVWHIDPAKSESGWRPHREVGHKALFENRRPKALSAWMALSDATPLNGCMYVVPADRDPVYGTPEDSRRDFELGDVRALPARPGDVFLWTQALLHWGGHASPQAPSARISMSFEYMHADVEPYFQPVIEPGSVASFEARLSLIGQQILRYRHMYGLPAQLEELARAI